MTETARGGLEVAAPRPWLTAEGLGRRVQGRWLVRGATWTVAAGQRWVLSGPNGAGKSVLLRLLAALDSPQEGRLLWRDAPLADRDIPAFRRQVIYCHQRAAMLPGTVEQNLRAPFAFRSAAGAAWDPARAAQLLRSAGRGEDFLRQSVEHLSGGELQVAALVRAVLLAPHVLLLDEPTSALDADTTAAVERLLANWQQERPTRALVWISHDPRQAERLGARVLHMANGHLIDGEHFPGATAHANP